MDNVVPGQRGVDQPNNVDSGHKRQADMNMQEAGKVTMN